MKSYDSSKQKESLADRHRKDIGALGLPIVRTTINLHSRQTIYALNSSF